MKSFLINTDKTKEWFIIIVYLINITECEPVFTRHLLNLLRETKMYKDIWIILPIIINCEIHSAEDKHVVSSTICFPLPTPHLQNN